jgi:predicted transposase YbfD/YdcC
MQQFASLFAVVPDPRAANARHLFTEVLFIAIAAVLCGARNCSEMALFGEAKEALLRQILKLPYGIPSHDTFSAIFRNLDPTAFAQSFGRLTAAIAQALEAKPGVVAIDGKATKGAFAKGQRHAPRMMVTAWGAEIRMTLAGRPVRDGNEAKAAIELLSLIDIKGATVTTDALHCSREMAQGVIDRAGEYVLALKGNQGPLHAAAQALIEAGAAAAPSAETRDVAHGRAELRRAIVVAVPGLAETHRFPGLTAIGRIDSVREIDGVREETTRLFALSRVLAPVEFLRIVREHWGIETSLHWVLDVVLDEDRQRTRKDHGPDNLALLRRFALNVLRQDKSKGSLTGKMKRAGWDDVFLLSLLAHMR